MKTLFISLKKLSQECTVEFSKGYMTWYHNRLKAEGNVRIYLQSIKLDIKGYLQKDKARLFSINNFFCFGKCNYFA